MSRCPNCGSNYGRRYQDTCPMCDSSLVINSYHGGSMELQKLGTCVDSHHRTIHLGVELEVDGFPNETARLEAAHQVFKILNRPTKQMVKIERDGSLMNGFEIISQPIQYGYHKFSVKWAEAFKAIEALGGSSHNGGRCGLHVHIDRYSERFVENMWKLVNKVYKDELKLFSRRTDFHYCQFDDSQEYEWRNESHYAACSTQTSTGRTIEIRLFRGTTKWETFMECLRLCERLCWLALESHDVLEDKMPKFDNLLSEYGKAYMNVRRGR